MRILIADDDLTCRKMLSVMLKKSGYDVLEAGNGLEALEVLRGSYAPELAICDWMMPEIDGLEVVRRVRAVQAEFSPYIIMLTNRGGKLDIIAGLEAGADDYLAKPFDIGELQARLLVGKRVIDMQKRLDLRVKELRMAMDQIETLRGILPICSFCNNIRNDQGCWDPVDIYISRHSRAEFSHTVCPECMEKHYPEYDDKGSNDV